MILSHIRAMEDKLVVLCTASRIFASDRVERAVEEVVLSLK